jgi:hypothetical protein
LGMVYALMGNRSRSLGYFRELIDRHPKRVGEVADLFARSPKLRESIDSQPGFPEALLQRCPEIFAVPAGAASSSEPNSSQPSAQKHSSSKPRPSSPLNSSENKGTQTPIEGQAEGPEEHM